MINRQIGQPTNADIDSVGKSPRMNVVGLKVSSNVFAAQKPAKWMVLHLSQIASNESTVASSGVAQYRLRKALVFDILQVLKQRWEKFVVESSFGEWIKDSARGDVRSRALFHARRGCCVTC